jgi:hypothetical protein
MVREGRWLYARSVEVVVRIRESDTRFGPGDYEDPPQVRESVASLPLAPNAERQYR